MYKGKKIAVVVPAFREERLIRKTIDSVPEYVDRIIAIDDCSPDRTLEILKRLKVKYGSRLIIIRHKTNQGVGASVFTGYEEALKLGMDIAVVMAGDAQMDPSDFESVVIPIIDDKADYTKGNRLLTGDVKKIMPGHRYIGNSILTILTKIASGYWNVMDPQCGYTAINKRAMELVPFSKIFPRYGFPNDLLTKLNVYNLRVVDVPVKPVYGKEKSGISLVRYVPRLSYLLMKCFLWRLREKYLIRDFHPLFLFYTFGFLSIITGGLLALYILYLRLFKHNIATVASIILCAMLLMMGLQTIFFAMWFDMQHNQGG
ncbi:MAG: glycosyltransferase family 2 protein [archaeon]